MSSKLNRVIGGRVRLARDAAGLTQEQLAERVDRTKEAISNIERGVNLPTIETLDRICEVLGTDIRNMFGDAKGNSRKVKSLARIEMLIAGMTDSQVELTATIVSAIAEHRPIADDLIR